MNLLKADVTPDTSDINCLGLQLSYIVYGHISSNASVYVTKIEQNTHTFFPCLNRADRSKNTRILPSLGP